MGKKATAWKKERAFSSLQTSLKDLQGYKKQAQAAIEKLEKEKAEAVDKQKAKDSAEEKKIEVGLKQVAEKGKLKMTPSGVHWNFVADLENPDKPLCVVIPEGRMGPALERLAALEYYALQKKWASKRCQESRSSYIVSMIGRAAASRKIYNLLENMGNMGPENSNKFSNELADVFALQFEKTEAGATQKFRPNTPFGLVEVKLCIEGTLHVYGVHYEAITGSSLAEKKIVLEAMDSEPFVKLAEGPSGFHAVVKAGMGLAIPGNMFAFVVIAEKGTDHMGLRWSLMGGKKRMGDTMKYLKELKPKATDVRHNLLAFLDGKISG